MDALEEIQQAIEKLTELKAKSTPEPLEGVNATDVFTSERENDQLVASFASGRTDVTYMEEAANRSLFLTLHRTIDAQLAILRHIATHYSDSIGIGTTNSHVLALARAINGGA